MSTGSLFHAHDLNPHQYGGSDANCNVLHGLDRTLGIHNALHEGCQVLRSKLNQMEAPSLQAGQQYASQQLQGSNQLAFRTCRQSVWILAFLKLLLKPPIPSQNLVGQSSPGLKLVIYDRQLVAAGGKAANMMIFTKAKVTSNHQSPEGNFMLWKISFKKAWLGSASIHPESVLGQPQHCRGL